MEVKAFGEYDFSEFLKVHSEESLKGVLMKHYDCNNIAFPEFDIWIKRDELVKLVNNL